MGDVVLDESGRGDAVSKIGTPRCHLCDGKHRGNSPGHVVERLPGVLYLDVTTRLGSCEM